MAQLNKSAVTFVLPQGDNKDFDTRVRIYVKKKDGSIIAQNENVAPGQPFPDPGTYGPYDLNIINANSTNVEFSDGKSELQIQPVGNDRWITNVKISMGWSDGLTAACESGNIIVDQDVNTARWSNS